MLHNKYYNIFENQINFLDNLKPKYKKTLTQYANSNLKRRLWDMTAEEEDKLPLRQTDDDNLQWIFDNIPRYYGPDLHLYTGIYNGRNDKIPSYLTYDYVFTSLNEKIIKSFDQDPYNIKLKTLVEINIKGREDVSLIPLAQFSKDYSQEQVLLPPSGIYTKSKTSRDKSVFDYEPAYDYSEIKKQIQILNSLEPKYKEILARYFKD